MRRQALEAMLQVLSGKLKERFSESSLDHPGPLKPNILCHHCLRLLPSCLESLLNQSWFLLPTWSSCEGLHTQPLTSRCHEDVLPRQCPMLWSWPKYWAHTLSPGGQCGVFPPYPFSQKQNASSDTLPFPHFYLALGLGTKGLSPGDSSKLHPSWDGLTQQLQ